MIHQCFDFNVYWHGLNLVQAWTITNMPSKVCVEITYPSSNFNGYTVEVWERINSFIAHFTMDVITYHAGIQFKPC